jgi:hypothetical protein
MRSLTRLGQRRELTGTTYQLTDCLHHGRTVYVSADGIRLRGVGLAGGARRTQPLG